MPTLQQTTARPWMTMGSLGLNKFTHWGQNGHHYADNIFKCIFSNITCISINISLKFVPKGQFYNIPSLVQTMAWRWPGDKPLSEPMMVRLLKHICITRPKWVNSLATTDAIWWLRIWVNVGSGNGSLLDGTKPSPEPILTYHQLSPLVITWGNFTRNAQDINLDNIL